MEEVKKLFHRKSSQKELGESSTQEGTSNHSTSSRWRRRSQSRGRASSGQKSRTFESSPYDAQPEGITPTQGAEPLPGNASSASRNRNSMRDTPEHEPPFQAPASGTAAPVNSARPASAVFSSSPTDAMAAPKTPNNRHSYQHPPDTSPNQRSPTLPIAEQFSQASYYDHNQGKASTGIPSVAAQTRRRDLPVRTAANGDSSLTHPSDETDQRYHPVGPRSHPARNTVSPSTSPDGSINIPKRPGVSTTGDGSSGLGVAGGRQLSSGSYANGIIQKGPYTKPGTASGSMSSRSVAATTADYSAEGKRYLVEGATEPPSLEGIVDLRNTTQTTVHTTWAKPVYHERIMPKIHHITHPIIERRIHNHEIFHRILPVIDVQVLPAKHYAPHGPGGSLIEIGQDILPGRTGTNQHWVVAETVSKMGDEDSGASEPRKFSARGFAKTDGRVKSYTGANGIPTTEQSWVHSPTIHEGARGTGQTEALHFGEPRADGIFHERPGAQSRRERNAEDVVAVDAARRAANGAGSRTQAAEIAYSNKGYAQREREAEQSIVGQRTAGLGHRGIA